MNKSRKKHTPTTPPEMPEAMVALAGGLADDFNNILTVVLGACSLIDSNSSSGSELLRCVYLIRTSAEHAAVLSNRLVLLCSVQNQQVLETQ